ncbi:MAG: hypothetical protein H6569_14060 [Lewinellaceae bacterium]|nr:hypothetical protein [Lewinellaceae bacterium]
MKTSGWITLIGVVCIVFGALGVLDIFLMLMMGGISGIGSTAGNAQTPRWPQYANYFGNFVDVLYLLAGVFFLQKKSFSLRLMYTVLILSVVSGIVPWMVLSWQNGSFFKFNLFVLVGPIIDVLLLIGVYRIRNYYWTEPNHVVYFPGTGTRTPRQQLILSLVGLACFLIPLSIFSLWVYVSGLGKPHAEAVELYNSYFPKFLRARYSASYLSLICCLAGIVSSSIGLKLSGAGWKALNITVMAGCIMLMLLNLFSLM